MLLRYSRDVTDWSKEWGRPCIAIRSAMLPSELNHFSGIIQCDLYAEKASVTLAKQTCYILQSFNFLEFRCFFLLIDPYKYVS